MEFFPGLACYSMRIWGKGPPPPLLFQGRVVCTLAARASLQNSASRRSSARVDGGRWWSELSSALNVTPRN
eukprot:3306134-Pyramimonas_sp.AAC.1